MTTSRPLSAEVAGESLQVQAMTAELLHVSWVDLKSQMVVAGVPGAKDIEWKVDLIALAVQHKFVYAFKRKGLGLRF